MIVAVAGAVVGTLVSIVVVHYVRIGLRRWLKKDTVNDPSKQ